MGIRKASQAGYALLFVMAIGVVGLYSVTNLIGDGSVTEREAQDRELLKLRAYWAGMGHIAYIISRSRQGPPCGNECINKVNREDFYVAANKELNVFEKGAFIGAPNGRDRHWAYPEISPNYFLPLHLHVDFPPGAPKFEFRVHYQDAAPIGKNPVPFIHPFLSENWPVRGGFAAIACVGMTDFGSTCPSSVNAMDKTSSLTRIIRLEPR